MKNLFILLILAASCHKSNNLPPSVTHYNDSTIIGKWNSHLPGTMVNGGTNVITFTDDSMNYDLTNPLYQYSNQKNKSYTIHDTLFINSKPSYTFYFQNNKLYIVSFDFVTNYLTKVVPITTTITNP